MMSWLRTLANRDEDEGALGRHAALLMSLVLLLVALPIAQMLIGGAAGFPLLLTLVLIAAILVNSHQRGVFILAAILGVTAIGGILTAEAMSLPNLRVVSQVLGLALLGMTTLVMLNSLIQAAQVSRDTIVGGICVYLLVGLCFAICFIAMTEVAPGALTADGEAIVRNEADPSAHARQLLYFSFVTLTTLGYGDIAPRADLAQMFAVAEAVTGQLYLTIFVARLVALYVRRQPNDPTI